LSFRLETNGWQFEPGYHPPSFVKEIKFIDQRKNYYPFKDFPPWRKVVVAISRQKCWVQNMQTPKAQPVEVSYFWRVLLHIICCRTKRRFYKRVNFTILLFQLTILKVMHALWRRRKMWNFKASISLPLKLYFLCPGSWDIEAILVPCKRIKIFAFSKDTPSYITIIVRLQTWQQNAWFLANVSNIANQTLLARIENFFPFTNYYS
jgi:hypothetical protein